MKRKKLLKSASLVALSTVMMCGAAVSFAGCGTDAYTIVVSMFCSDADAAVNKQNCLDWAAQYTKELRANGTFSDSDKDISIKFTSMSDTDAYFTSLQKQIVSNNQPDVFYVSPKYVKTWRNQGKLVDLSAALASDAETLTDVWEDSLAFYAYADDANYAQGDRITYDGSKFVTVKNQTPVGIYGLPKDYSNFGLGFNAKYFDEDVRQALTSKKTTDRTGIKGAQYSSVLCTYNGEKGVVTDADGNDVPLINIGKPTWYRPYNFYKFSSYNAALQGGDPMATLVDYYTDGEGYCVTIPGFPGDTFADAKEKYGTYSSSSDEGWDKISGEMPADKQNAEAEYDEKQGYITLTYAEYSALTWAVTYYINTYNWDGTGVGGFTSANGRANVYGNDQYDGVLYLLPWLAGNDVQYLNADSTAVINPGKSGSETGTKMLSDTEAATYTMSKTGLDGKEEKKTMYWGANSERFIETVGAFHAYGSDWNGNSNNAGDTNETKASGWDLFNAGNCVFYGVGTWNGGALNGTDRQFLEYRLCPEPVSESYALASYIKDADYKMKGYGDIDDDGSGAKDSYSAADIIANQVERQDKWGARMDSVGYGVSSNAGDSGDWREAAAIELVKYLTITPETQVTLTYAGAQLPNFKSQCKEFYEGNTNPDGDFAKMVTPDDGEKWDTLYQIARDMNAAATTNPNMTVGKWMSMNHPDVDYDHAFEGTPFSQVANLSWPMKILYLVSYTKADRDLSLRMQFGLNATRDSAMYTYNDLWLGPLEPRQKNMVMAYANQASYTLANGGKSMSDILDATLYAKDSTSSTLPALGSSYGTPAWFCLHQCAEAKTLLDQAIKDEQDAMR